MVANRQASYFSYVGLQRDMGQAWPLLKFIIHYHLEIFTSGLTKIDSVCNIEREDVSFNVGMCTSATWSSI